MYENWGEKNHENILFQWYTDLNDNKKWRLDY